MGQFKPMVKMETTEPTVELKLKKGGRATHERAKLEGGRVPSGMMGSKGISKGGKLVKKADGGMMGAAGPVTPVVNPAAVRAMAAQRMARRPAPMTNPTAPGRPGMPMARPAMKEGGKMDIAQDKAMIKKAFKEHDAQEHKGGKGTKLKLATGGVAKGNGGGYATGGVVNGQGGYKTGGKVAASGIIKDEGGAASGTKMRTARPDNAPAKTGDVKLGNSGGYRKGGAAKKFAEGGRVQDDGGPEQMKQGRKPVPSPVKITALSGTYKKGGDVSVSKLRAENKAEFAPTMKAAKKDSNEKYGPSRNFMK
jgi:hypothetical protein